MLIQRTTNVDLIKAELAKKKQSNWGKGKNYAFKRVLNLETIKEREAYKQLKEHWAWISRCQPNLLIPKKKKASSPVKKAAKRLDLQLTPSALSFLSPKKVKTPARQASPVKSIGKAPVSLALVLPQKTKGQASGLRIRQAMGQATEQAAEQGTEQATEQAIGQVTGISSVNEPAKGERKRATTRPRTAKTPMARAATARLPVTEGTGQAQEQEERVIQTRSGRRSVKKVIFEAGKN